MISNFLSNIGKVTTLAGTPKKYGNTDGNESALFHSPSGILFHPFLKALIVCDTYNNAIRKISLDGTPILFMLTYFLSLNLGNVTTICNVQSPQYVGLLPNTNILVSTKLNKIFKIIFNGMLLVYIIILY